MKQENVDMKKETQKLNKKTHKNCRKCINPNILHAETKTKQCRLALSLTAMKQKHRNETVTDNTEMTHETQK